MTFFFFFLICEKINFYTQGFLIVVTDVNCIKANLNDHYYHLSSLSGVLKIQFKSETSLEETYLAY